jgi:hypothetical protein
MSELLPGANQFGAATRGATEARPRPRATAPSRSRRGCATVEVHSTIQAQRGDYNGKVLSIRQEDLLTLAVIYDEPPSQLAERLINWGVLRPSNRQPYE